METPHQWPANIILALNFKIISTIEYSCDYLQLFLQAMALDIVGNSIALLYTALDIADGVTFLKDRCILLKKSLTPLVKQVKSWDNVESREGKEFMKDLKKVLEDSEKVMKKCQNKGLFKRCFDGVIQKRKWQGKFEDLDKRITVLGVAAPLAIEVSP